MSSAKITGRVLAMGLALLGVMGLPRGARAQLSVDELEVILRPDVPAQRTGVIRITNDTDKPAQALLDVQDWRRNEAGANQFLPRGEVAGSCGELLTVFPMSVRIESHGTEAVRVNFSGAAQASCWSIVFVQANEPPRPASQQSQVTYVIRTGVKVYVQAEGAVRAGEVAAVALGMVPVSEQDTTSTLGVELLFRNIGEAHLRPAGAVELRSADNQVAAKLPVAQFPIAPGDSRRLRLPLPRLPPGRYVALALLDYSGPDIAAGQAEFEIRE